MSEPEDVKEPLALLHDLVLKELLARLGLGANACPHCGSTGISPQLLTVARQFLSDNEMKAIGGARPDAGKTVPMRLPFLVEGELPVQRSA